MIKLSNLNFDYGSEDSVVFRRVNLEFAPGELSLVVGPTGSGKSTLLKVINRLSPNFSGGRMSGTILVNEMDATNSKPRELAKLIGYVNQTPESSFVAETVIEELAFGMEQLGTAKTQMLENIEKYSEILGLTDLLHRPLEGLSAGQQQRVAIAAALVAGQRVLLLDEPTSALDENTATDLLQTLRRLAAEHGITVLITEHRIERLIDLSDTLVMLKGDGSAIKNDSNWHSLYSTFPGWLPKDPATTKENVFKAESAQVLLEIEGLTVRYPGSQHDALNDASLVIRNAEIVSLAGPNGSGKTTLLEAVAGQLHFTVGSVKHESMELIGSKASVINKTIRLVPQQASDLLFLNSVGQELKESDSYAKSAANTTSGIFSNLVGRINPAIHPRDLSVGQQLALVISMQLAVGSPLLLLDEPTRGLDYEAKAELVKQLRDVCDSGKSVLLATHDLEFARQVSNRIFHMESGRLVTEDEAAT